MNITILQGPFLPVPPLRGGAVEKLWFQLSKEFALLGHKVIHISRRFSTLPDFEISDSVAYIRIPGFDSRQFLPFSNLCDLVYSIRALSVLPPADILISNTFWLPLLQSNPVPIFGRVVVDVERMPKGQLSLYPHVSAFRCCSSAVSHKALSQAPALSKKLHVIPNPLPFSTTSAQPSVYEKTPTILYSGRIHPEKGLELLIRAYLCACKLGLNGWKLKVIGPSQITHGGGGPRYLRKLKLIAGTLDTIEFLDPIYDDHFLHKEYMNASIFVYPSLSESGEAFGVSPLEAMSFGCVPIVSSLRCFEDFIMHGRNGLIFDHRSSNSLDFLAASILQLATDPISLAAFAERAMRVRHSHHPTTIANSMISLFDRLLAQPSKQG